MTPTLVAHKYPDVEWSASIADQHALWPGKSFSRETPLDPVWQPVPAEVSNAAS